jgi:hypothetical protein
MAIEFDVKKRRAVTLTDTDRSSHFPIIGLSQRVRHDRASFHPSLDFPDTFSCFIRLCTSCASRVLPPGTQEERHVGKNVQHKHRQQTCLRLEVAYPWIASRIAACQIRFTS